MGQSPNRDHKGQNAIRHLITIQKSQEINRKHILVGLYSELDNVTVFSLIHITLVCGQGQKTVFWTQKCPKI